MNQLSEQLKFWEKIFKDFERMGYDKKSREYYTLLELIEVIESFIDCDGISEEIREQIYQIKGLKNA